MAVLNESINQVNKLEQELEKLSKGLNTFIYKIGAIDRNLVQSFDIEDLKNNVKELQKLAETRKGMTNISDKVTLRDNVKSQLTSYAGKFKELKKLEAESAIKEFDTSKGEGIKVELNKVIADLNNEDVINKIKEVSEKEAKELMQMIEVFNLVENQMGKHTEFGTRDANTLLQLASGKSLNTNKSSAEAIRSNITGYINNLDNLYEKVDGKYVGKDAYEEDTINETLAEIKELKEELKKEIQDNTVKDLKGYLKMYKDAFKVKSFIESRKDFHEYILSPFSQDDLNFKANARELLPKYEVKDISEYYKPVESNDALVEKNKLLKEQYMVQSDLIKQSKVDEIYSQDNAKQILKDRAETIELYKNRLNQIKGINVDTEKSKYVEANSVELHEYVINLDRAIESANRFRIEMANVQNQMNNAMNKPFRDIQIDKILQTENMLNSGLHVNLIKEDDISKYNLLLNLIKTIKEEANSIEFNNLNKEAVVSTNQLEQLRKYIGKAESFNVAEKNKQYLEVSNRIKQLEYDKKQFKDIKKLRESLNLNEHDMINIDNTISLIDEYIKKSKDLSRLLSNNFKELHIEKPKLGEFKPKKNVDGLKSIREQLQSGYNEKRAEFGLDRQDKNVEKRIKEVKESVDLYRRLSSRLENINEKKQGKLDKYTGKKDKDAQTIRDIQAQFNKRESDISGLDTKGLDKSIQRIDILKKSLKDAINYGDINRVNSIWEAYISETDKVIGKHKEIEVAIKRQAKAQEDLTRAQEAQKKQAFDNVKNYVANWEAEHGQKMPLQDQLKYYNSEAENFKNYKNLYYPILRMRDSVQQQIDNKAEADRQKALRDKEADRKQRQDKLKRAYSKRDSIQEQFNKREAVLGGMDTKDFDKLNNKIALYRRELEKALQTLDVDKASRIWDVYANATDRVINRVSKVREEETRLNETNAQRQRLADEMYKAKFDAVKNHVANWEAEHGQKMPLQDQLEYYKSAIKQFENGSDEYLSIIKMQRSVEQQINDQAEAERQKALRDQEAQKKQTLDNIQTITNAMKNLSSFISNMVNRVLSVIKMGVNAIKSLAHGAISVINLFKNSLQRILTLFGNFGNRVGLVNRNGNLLKGTFTELRSKVQLLTTAFNRLFNNQFIKNGQELLSSIQTLNIIIGSELTENTIGWANELERAFGLSASGIIADLKELTAVMYGMGMSGEHSISASKNLNVMANQLSTIIGYDTATVVNKIQSGMKGMTQSIDDLGLSVREAQMNQFLKDLKAQGGEFANISTSFANLTEQQRIYVRYAAIMSQFMSKYDTKTYVASLETITGHIALLKNSLRSLASTVGTLFLQLFDKIVVPLIIMIRSIQSAVIKLAEWLNNIFNLGLKLDLSADMNGNSDSIKTTNDDLKDLGNTAEDTSKKMAGLDSFDHVSTMSSSDGGSGSDFDYSKLMDLFKDNDLASQMADLAKMQDDWLKKQKEKFIAWLHELKDKINNWYKDVTGREGIDFGFNFVVIFNALKRALKNIGNIIIQLRDIIGGVGIMILEDLQIGKIITRLTVLFADLTGFIRVALETLKPYIIDFYEKYLSPIFKKLGTVISDGIIKGIIKLNELTWWFKDPENSGAIQAWFDNLGRIVEKVSIIINTLFTGKTSTEDLIKLGDNGDNIFKLNEGAIYDVNNMAKSLHDIISSLIDILGQLFADFGTYMKEEGFSKISEALDKVDKFINNNKNTIIEIVKAIASLAKTFTEAMFNEFMELLQFLVDHKDLIKDICETLESAIKWISDHVNVFITLAGIKIFASAFSGIFKLADSISDIYITMQAIKGLRAGGGIFANLFGSGASAAAASGAESAVPLGAVSTAGIGASAMKLSAVGLIVGQVALTAKAVKKTVSEWPYLASQASTEAQTVFDLLNKKASLTGAQLRENAQTMLDGLIDIYGQEIPASGVEKMLESYKKRLEDAGIYTDEQINSWIGHAHRYIENFGTVVGSVDTSIYTSKLTQASSDISASAESIQGSNDRILSSIKNTNTEVEESVNQGASAIQGSNATILSSLSNTNNGIKEKTNEIKEVLPTYTGDIKNSTDEIAKSFSSLRSSSTKEMSNTYGQLSTHINGISGSFLGLKTSIANSINSITSKISELTRIKMPSFSFSSLFKSNSNTYTSVTSTKKIRGFANGGVPKSGSIFYANENGNLELAGNFGGYSGVANQNMIIQSMKQAIGETMYGAVTKAMKGNSRGNIQNTYEICKGGIFVGDNSSIRRLAELINNANISSTGNIANLGFSV